MADGSETRTSKSSARSKSARKKLYELHAWLGFHLAALMALVLATGTIATVSHEIDWVIQHDMRVVPDDEKVSWGTMYDAVLNARPDASILSLFEMEGDHFAYRARIVDAYGRQDFVHVNQWTGEVTGETHPLTVQRIFRDLHRYLFMPNFIGLPLVTSLAFVLAISLYTGLKTSRNWRTLLFRVRVNKGPRVLWGDAHKAAGLWSIWFFVIVIVTSLWYLFEFGAAASGNSVQAPRASVSLERVEAFGPTISNRDPDEIVRAATDAFPDWRPTLIFFPTSARQTIEIQGSVGNPFIRDRANRVFLDPEDLSVVKVQKAPQIGWASYLNEMADPLHFGVFGGLPTKLIWFIFGVFLTGLSLTGVWLTWRRLKTSKPSITQFATLPVLIISMLFATAWYDRLQGPSLPNQELKTVPVRVQEIVGQMGFEIKTDGTFTGRVRLEVTADDNRPNLKLVSITLLQNGVPLGEPVEQSARALRRRTEVKAVLQSNELQLADTVWVRLALNSDDERNLVWSVDHLEGTWNRH